MICTCGSDFITVETGVFVLTHKGLYAADLMECPYCSKQVLGGVSQTPVAAGPEVDQVLERLDSRGVMVYGR